MRLAVIFCHLLTASAFSGAAVRAAALTVDGDADSNDAAAGELTFEAVP